MKTVLRIIMICSWLVLTKTSFAQTEGYFSGYNKRIKILVETKEYDSIIAFSFHQHLDPPPPPPLTAPTAEILNKVSHYDDAFLVCFKNDSCFAICIADYGAGIGISNRILIEEKQAIDTLRQYWAKARKEYFLPFISKGKENKGNRYDTLKLLSAAEASLSFGSRSYYETKDFLPLVIEKTFNDLENMNYKHNSSLNLFTVYMILTRFYSSLSKQFIYHE